MTCIYIFVDSSCVLVPGCCYFSPGLPTNPLFAPQVFPPLPSPRHHCPPSSSSCFARGQRRGALQPAGFLARRSSSSAFCFHQWTAALHFCCVSKYLLAFLFLAAPIDVGVIKSTVRARARAPHRIALRHVHQLSCHPASGAITIQHFPHTPSSLSVHFPDLGSARQRKPSRKSLLLLPPTAFRVQSAGESKEGTKPLECPTNPTAATRWRGDHSQTNVQAPTIPIGRTSSPPTRPTHPVSPQGLVASSCCRGFPSCSGDKGSQGNDGGTQ